MTNELTALKRFYAYEHALVVSELLREEGIETEIRDSRTPVDFTMVDGGPPVAYDVLLAAKHLTKARKILGYEPQFNLRDAISETIQNVRAAMEASD